MTDAHGSILDAFLFDALLWPWMLGLTLLAPLAALYRARFKGDLRPSVFHTAQPRLAFGAAGLRARLAFVPGLCRVLAIALFALVLARPHDLSGRRETTTEGVAIQLVIDRSGSMGESIIFEGREVQRLAAVKRVVRQFIGAGEESRRDANDAGRDAPSRQSRAPGGSRPEPLDGRPGDLIGLIAFGTYADTIAPLTRDHPPLAELLETIDVARSESERATAIGDALALAVARLVKAEERLEEAARLAREELQAARRDTDPAPPTDQAAEDEPFELEGKIVILLTDGQNSAGRIDPLEAARFAKESGVRVYTIGIGGGVASLPQNNPLARMRALTRGITVDERTLNAIANSTGGKFFLADTGESLREIYAEIDQLETTEVAVTEFTEREPRYHAYLALALALLAAEILGASTIFRRAP